MDIIIINYIRIQICLYCTTVPYAQWFLFILCQMMGTSKVGIPFHYAEITIVNCAMPNNSKQKNSNNHWNIYYCILLCTINDALIFESFFFHDFFLILLLFAAYFMQMPTMPYGTISRYFFYDHRRTRGILNELRLLSQFLLNCFRHRRKRRREGGVGDKRYRGGKEDRADSFLCIVFVFVTQRNAPVSSGTWDLCCMFYLYIIVRAM